MNLVNNNNQSSKNSYTLKETIALEKKIEHSKLIIILSRLEIRKIILRSSLVRTYKVLFYKPTKSTTNEQKIDSKRSRYFDDRNLNEIILSDLGYVNVLGIEH